jgi:hypothetical protein
VLIPPRDGTIMDLLDVRDRRALIVMVDVPVRLFRVRGGAREPLPGLLEALLLAADGDRRRLLGVHEGRAIVFGDDGSMIAEGSEERGRPVLRDGELWFARAIDGEVVLAPADPSRPARRIAGKLPGELDRVHCGAAGQCFVSFYEGELRHAVLDGDALGPAFTVPVRERDLALAPGGTRAAVVAHGELMVFDIAGGTLGPVLHRAAAGCDLDDPVWSPSGQTLFFSTDCEGPSEIYALRIAGGKPRKLETVSGFLSGVEALGDDDLVYSTVDYQSRLVLVDDLPTATSAE